MNILLLSAYAARSHEHWRDALAQLLPDCEFTALTLPPRYFSWRVRGNPLYWSVAERARLEARYDVLLATSMVDLATLRGLVPALADVPTVLYFHENQFAYPPGAARHGLLEAQMVSLYSALAADRIAFNSAYNRDSFLDGVTALLARLPDKVPPGVVAGLAAKAEVLAVPLADFPPPSPDWPGPTQSGDGAPLRLAWVGRLEHDKGGEGLHRVLNRLEAGGRPFELALVGQTFRDEPAVFTRLRDEFAHRLVHCGFIDNRDHYLSLLAGADLVLSTAHHEFQGLAILEAVACGCLPVVPDRLAYAELYAAQFRYRSTPAQPEVEAAAAVALIDALAARRRRGLRAPDVSAFRGAALAPRYRDMLAAAIAAHRMAWRR